MYATVQVLVCVNVAHFMLADLLHRILLLTDARLLSNFRTFMGSLCRAWTS